ncbi:MAG: hypothetical protein V4631_10925 [Pseudomonadota bacterium]
MPVHALCKPLVSLAAVIAMALVNMGAVPVAPTLVAHLAQHRAALANAGRAPAEAAHYLEISLASLGYEAIRRSYTHLGRRMHSVEAAYANPSSPRPASSTFIVGASCSGAPAVIELARLLKGERLAEGTELKFVVFVGADDGKGARAGPFIAFSGPRGAAVQVRKALASFRAVSNGADEGLATPAYLESVTVSGTLLMTDSATLRYPYSHTAKADDGVAGDVASMARLIASMAAPARM